MRLVDFLVWVFCVAMDESFDSDWLAVITVECVEEVADCRSASELLLLWLLLVELLEGLGLVGLVLLARGFDPDFGLVFKLL